MNHKPLKHLDLFSGIGGFALGLQWAGGFETVGFCEIDPYCQKVLNKNFPEVPIYDDVRTLEHDGTVDIITGGYPCQPFSMAGKRKGKEDDRHLWPAMFDLIKKHRPTWVIGENVAGHINMGLDDVLTDLESENYSVRTFVIPAVAVDAKHRRDRVWIIASKDVSDTNRQRPYRENLNQQREDEPFDGKIGIAGQVCEILANRRNTKKGRASDIISDTHSSYSEAGAKPTGRKKGPDFNRQGEGTIVANTQGGGQFQGHENYGGLYQGKAEPKTGHGPADSSKTISNPRSAGRKGREKTRHDGSDRSESRNKQPTGCNGVQEWSIWPSEPSVGRVANGIPKRVDRLKGLGNAVTPQIPELLGRAIINSMKEAA